MTAQSGSFYVSARYEDTVPADILTRLWRILHGGELRVNGELHVGGRSIAAIGCTQSGVDMRGAANAVAAAFPENVELSVEWEQGTKHGDHGSVWIWSSDATDADWEACRRGEIKVVDDDPAYAILP